MSPDILTFSKCKYLGDSTTNLATLLPAKGGEGKSLLHECSVVKLGWNAHLLICVSPFLFELGGVCCVSVNTDTAVNIGRYCQC